MYSCQIISGGKLCHKSPQFKAAINIASKLDKTERWKIITKQYANNGEFIINTIIIIIFKLYTIFISLWFVLHV